MLANRMRRTWNGRVDDWHHHVNDAPAFESVRRQLLALAAPAAIDRCVDLGAGTGFVTVPLARETARVLAVDVAPQMLAALEAEARAHGLGNIDLLTGDLSTLTLPDGSVDLIVSSYALHHLSHAEKRALVARCARWLAPGGRLVIADMMFGRGATRRDRQIAGQKARALLAKGPAGVWRLAKNLVRFSLAVGQERPATPEFWQRALVDAGFQEVSFQSVVAEAGIVRGVAPVRPLTDALRAGGTRAARPYSLTN